MAIGLIGVGTDRWDNVKALIVDPTVTERGSAASISLIDVAHPWSPFQNADLAASALARTAIHHEDSATALAVFTGNKVGKYHTPVAEWLHSILRASFDDLYPDDDTYAQEFDRAEVMLGLISQDLAIQDATTSGRSWRSRSRWFGRSTWRANHSSVNSLEIISKQLEAQQGEWGPLRAGLFGRDPKRAAIAVDAYRESFSELSRTRY